MSPYIANTRTYFSGGGRIFSTRSWCVLFRTAVKHPGTGCLDIYIHWWSRLLEHACISKFLALDVVYCVIGSQAHMLLCKLWERDSLLGVYMMQLICLWHKYMGWWGYIFVKACCWCIDSSGNVIYLASEKKAVKKINGYIHMWAGTADVKAWIKTKGIVMKIMKHGIYKESSNMCHG